MEPLANSRHEKFCQALARGLSATAAYAEAGYSKKSADRNSHRLLKNEGVSQRVGWLKKQAVDETVMSAKEVLARLSNIARDETVSTRDRLAALTAIARYHGLFTDRIDYSTGAASPQIQIFLPDNGRDKHIN